MTTGMVFDLKRYAIHDGPGIRTTVFLKGCPLKCWWCHNPEGLSSERELVYHRNRCVLCGTCVDVCGQHAITISNGLVTTNSAPCDLCEKCVKVCAAEAREMVGREMTVQEVMEDVARDIPFFDESEGGVTFSGGEPLAQPTFLLDLLEACRRLGVHTAVDTSGHAGRDLLMKVAATTDLFLYDLKHMDPEIHRKYTGVTNEAILDNLGSLSEAGARIHVRFPLIPGINDDKGNLSATGKFLQQLQNVERVDILPLHGEMTGKYRRFGIDYRLSRSTVPDAAHIHRVAETLASYGLRVTIGGNENERADSQTQKSQPRGQTEHLG